MHTYKVYEEGKVVFIGSAKEVKKKFGLRRDASMGSYVTKKKNYRMLGKYDVEVCDDVQRKPKRDINWEVLNMMLVVRKERLTSVTEDPHKYVKRLNDLGVNVKITPYMSYEVIEPTLTKPRRKRIPKMCWYVERV